MQGTQWIYELVDKISAPVTRIGKELDKLDDLAEKTERNLNQLGQTNFGFNITQQANQAGQATGVFNRLLGGISPLFKTAAVAAGGFFAAQKLGDMGHQIFEVGAGMEQLRIGYITLLRGDSALADKLIGQMKEFGKATTFSNEEVLSSGQSLIAFGVDAGKLMPTIQTLGDLSMGNSEKFKSLVDNYGKMVSAQRGNTMDLNQFAIAGVPIWEELEKITGKSGQALRKYVEENGVGMDIIDRAFANLTGSGGRFFKALENQNATTTAKWGSYLAAVDELYLKIFKKLQPIINKVLDFGNTAIPVIEGALRTVWNTAKSVFSFFSKHETTLKAIAIGLMGIAAAWVVLNAEMLITEALWAGAAAMVWALDAAQWASTTAQNALNAAMKANPIAKVIVLIGALVALIYYLWNESEHFRGVVYGVWESLKVLGQGILEISSGILDGFIKTLIGIGKVLFALFTFDFDLFKSGINDWTDGMTEMFSGTVDKAAKVGEDAGKAYAKGVQLGQASFAADAAANEQPGKSEKSVVPGGTTPKNEADTNKSTTGGSTAEGKSGGGGIVVQKIELGRQIVINAANVKEGAGTMRDIIREELMGALRDIQVGMG